MQHRPEREDRKSAAQNRELRQKVKELERTVARQQKLIDRLQPSAEPSTEAEGSAPLPSPASPAASVPAAPPASTGCCDAPEIRVLALAGRKYRICANCTTRSRVG